MRLASRMELVPRRREIFGQIYGKAGPIRGTLVKARCLYMHRACASFCSYILLIRAR